MELLLALLAGAAAISRDRVAKAVVVAYDRLKTLVLRKFAGSGDVAASIDAVEREPDSEVLRRALMHDLRTAGADQDKEAIRLSRVLIELVQLRDPTLLSKIDDPSMLGEKPSGHGTGEGSAMPPKSFRLPSAPRLRTPIWGSSTPRPGFLGDNKAEEPPRPRRRSGSKPPGPKASPSRTLESLPPAAAPPPSPGGTGAPGTAVPAPPAPSRGQRWINAQLEDHEREVPLVKGHVYTLAFDVDVVQREQAMGIAKFAETNLFPEGVETVQLTVQLDSNDFAISDEKRPLRVPRTGRSMKARFDIEPLHDGPSRVTATIHKNRNFIQQMELTFDVGSQVPSAVEVTSKGRPASAVSVVQPRDGSLVINPRGEEYEVVAVASVSSRARLPLQPAYLASAIDAAREELLKIVMYQNDAGESVFQTGIDISSPDSKFALKTMARAGARLFQKLFFGPAAADDSKRVGEWLRKMATDTNTRLTLQIVAERAPLPWGLLYFGDANEDAKLDWNLFLGMRHIVEQIPLQTTLGISDCRIPSDRPDLAVSVNVNCGIDEQMGAPFVGRQRTFWANVTKSRQHIRVAQRTRRAEVVEALADRNTSDQILYFYCHAESVGLTDPGGPDASRLVLTDAGVTLGELSLDAPTSTPLRGSPLVFINACESADLSPTFYDGFVPYFVAKGARGVIGTECKTPALFAEEWATRFFKRFLAGQPLGATVLNLRREFLEKHRNPLGLLYAVHCDGDTQITPAV
jgi:hypothetical protein